MIEGIDHNFIVFFLNSIFLQSDGGIFEMIGKGRGALGSTDPIVKGLF